MELLTLISAIKIWC